MVLQTTYLEDHLHGAKGHSRDQELLRDIYAGKSAKFLRNTYGVNIQRNHAIRDRAVNAERLLKSVDLGTLLLLQEQQQAFYDKYDFRRLKRLRNWEEVDTRLTNTRNYVNKETDKGRKRLLEEWRADVKPQEEPPYIPQVKKGHGIPIVCLGLFTCALAYTTLAVAGFQPIQYEETLVDKNTIHLQTTVSNNTFGIEALKTKPAPIVDIQVFNPEGESYLKGDFEGKSLQGLDPTLFNLLEGNVRRGSDAISFTDTGLCAGMIVQPLTEAGKFKCVNPSKKAMTTTISWEEKNTSLDDIGGKDFDEPRKDLGLSNKERENFKRFLDPSMQY